MALYRPSQASPVTQELRLATTMTGGVSLAVWMAGVTREINLLSQASRWRRVSGHSPPTSGCLSDQARSALELYTKLIDLLDVVVEVDTLSGTSAGGINAALLAWSRVWGSDLGGLREVWIDLGSLTDLLRDPTDKDTPSLLYGDQKMFAGLAKAIPTFKDGPFPPTEVPSTALYITTTLLAGETSRFTDTFGTLVQDVDRRGVFTFTEAQLADEGNAGALALAARSSASFPLAFEPSFVPFGTGTAKTATVPARPPMQEFTNITRPHWVADGGLLDNRPIDVLLERIFDLPASGPVRRVLLFVVPSAGPEPDLVKEDPGDAVNSPLGLVDGLLKDLVAVTTQSIATDLRAIRVHQDDMAARTNARLRLTEIAERLPRNQRLLTTELLADYRTHEATKRAYDLTTALLRQLSTWPPARGGSTDGIPTTWQHDLRAGGDAEKMCRKTIHDAIRDHWPEQRPDNPAAFARYGRPALELAKGYALAVAAVAYRLAETNDDIRSLGPLTDRIHAACKPDEPGNPTTPSALAELVRRVCTDERVRSKTLTEAAGELAAAYLTYLTTRADAWLALGRALVDGHNDLQHLCARDPSTADAGQLRSYLDYLTSWNATAQATEATRNKRAAVLATKLFDLAITQRAMLPAGADVEQSVELAQLSADTRSLLAPDRQTAQQKLTGMQFHHFGAFYKPSWRANDWMWGRLDGAGWLVHVLLDPRRVHWIVNNRPAAGTDRLDGVQWFLNQLKEIGAPQFPPGGFRLPELGGKSEELLTEAALVAELGFLNDPDPELPRSVPKTAMWLAHAWQRQVLAEELDEVATMVINPHPGKTPDWSPTRSLAWARQVLATDSTDDKCKLLNADPIADETLLGDKGSPLMARTITKAVATSTAAIGSVRYLPGVVRPPLMTLRTLALGGYRVVTLTKGCARRSLSAGAALLIVGFAFAIQDAMIAGMSGLAMAVVGSYLMVLGIWQRWNRRLSAALSATVVVAMLSLAVPSVRERLFGTRGVVQDHVSWLGTAWWHPYVIMVPIVLVALAAKPRRKPGRRP